MWTFYWQRVLLDFQILQAGKEVSSYKAVVPLDNRILSVDHERVKKFGPSASPVSPAKAAHRNKSSPYLIPQWVLSPEPSFMPRALSDAYLPTTHSAAGPHKVTENFLQVTT